MKNICNTLLFADITHNKKAVLYRRDAIGTYKKVKSIRYASWLDGNDVYLLVNRYNTPKRNEYREGICEYFPDELIHPDCVFPIAGMDDSPKLCIHAPHPDRDEAWLVIEIGKGMYIHVSSYQIFCELTLENLE